MTNWINQAVKDDRCSRAFANEVRNHLDAAEYRERTLRYLCDSMSQKQSEAEAAIRHADKLAYEVACAILNREHGKRSAVSYSLLNYLNIGGISGPKTVPEWMDKYRAAKGGGAG